MLATLRLIDLVEKNKLEQILKAFTDVTKVASIITEVDGKPITEQHNFTSLCKNYSRSTPQGCQKCYESDSFGGHATQRMKKCVIYNCRNAGLLDCGAPIIVGGRHLANFMFGQVLEKKIPTEDAIKRARAIGVRDIDGYLRELDKIPIMTRAQLGSIANFMEVITQTISELALQKHFLHTHSQNFINNILNSASDCIISLGEDLNITRINRKGARMFGAMEESIVGQSLTALMYDESSKNRCGKYIKLNNNNRAYCHLNAARVDKSSFPIQMTSSKITIGPDEKYGYVLVIRDVTEEKQLECLKEDLIGMLTHDLGNPALSILKAMQVLLNGDLGPLNEGQREVVNLSMGTSQQMLDMLDDFLDIYRMESGRFILYKDFAMLDTLIQDCLRKQAFFAQEKQIQIRYDGGEQPMIVMVDENRFHRVIMNLLENAIKFSPEKSEIIINAMAIEWQTVPDNHPIVVPEVLSQIEADRQYILLQVTDDGYGIKSGAQKNIFDKFYTAQVKGSSGRKGTGLGLAFCKMIVEAHDGFIWVQSPLFETKALNRRGCRFDILLPLGSTE